MGISVKNLTHIYLLGSSWEKIALNDISFSIEEGETFAILGSTGSGKSTLAQHFNGLLFPTTGVISIDDIEVKPGVNLSKLRQRVGLVFQFPENQLFAETVYDDVAFGLKNLGCNENQIEIQVKEALDLVGIDFYRYKDRNPLLLSAGEKRKVALAGILAMKCKVLVLDEPLVGLDARGKSEILNLVLNYQKINKAIVVYITHSIIEALTLGNRGIILEEGKLMYYGNLEEFLLKGNNLLKSRMESVPYLEISQKLQALGMPIKLAYTKSGLIEEIEKCFHILKT